VIDQGVANATLTGRNDGWGPPLLQDVELEREGLAVPLLEAGLAEAALRGVDEQVEGTEAATVVADPILTSLICDRRMVEESSQKKLPSTLKVGTDRSHSSQRTR